MAQTPTTEHIERFEDLLEDESEWYAEYFARIEQVPGRLGGKPVIKGTRLSVELILGLLAAGESPADIVAEYYWLKPEDIVACLRYAQRAVQQVPKVTVELVLPEQ